MNFIFASPHLVYPKVPHGGGQDMMALLRFLRPRHSLRLAAFVSHRTAARAQELRPFVDDLHLVWPANTPRQRLANAAAALRAGRWRTLGRRAHFEMRDTLAAWASHNQPAVLYCVYTGMGRYLSAAPPGTVRVLDEVDVRFMFEQSEAQRAGRFSTQRWHAARRRAEELAYCRQADLVVTRSARDLDILRAAVPGLRGVVLPPYAYLDELRVRAEGEAALALAEAGRVLFTGAMDREPNQRAVLWLAREVWPRVRAAQPSAVLRVVGANPPPPLRRLADDCPGIEVTGWVDDLPGEYLRARVLAAPMLHEAGAFNKVISALAAGRPVVGTRLANAGVQAPPTAFTEAASPADFAAALCGLLANDAAWRAQAEAARRFAHAAFNYERAAGELEAELARLTHRP